MTRRLGILGVLVGYRLAAGRYSEKGKFDPSRELRPSVEPLWSRGRSKRDHVRSFVT
jgi:hypothetical protein